MNVKAIMLSLLLAPAAQAETITLQQADCGNTAYCAHVENSSGYDITVTYSALHHRTTVSVNGQLYDSGQDSLDPPFINLPLATVGGQGFFSASFTTKRVYVSSGRAHYWVTQWTLDGGILVR